MKVGGALAMVAVIAAAGCCLAQAPERKATVTSLEKTGSDYRLTRAGQPYWIRGAGGRDYLELLKDSGANSIRTWGEEDIEDLLNRCQAQGLSVCVGIWLGQERQGFNYGNEGAVRAEVEKCVRMVHRYKDHPAVLMWGLGNEMEGSGENEKIWRTVNEISQKVKAEDPNHPTMTVIAEIGDGGSKARHFNDLCPDVDILGINSYAGLPSLPKRLAQAGFTRPYVVTEYGPQGSWEVRKTPWGSPVEETSTRKAERYAENYERCLVEQKEQCLGGYAFLWGHKQETTATWFGALLSSGERLGAVDALAHGWSGKWPANRAPQLAKITTEVAEKEVTPGAKFTAVADVTDPDGDPLTLRWEVRSDAREVRQGGDPEHAPLPVPEAFIEAKGKEFTFRAPSQPGAYRVYCYVYDGKGSAATGNVPFFVKR